MSEDHLPSALHMSVRTQYVEAERHPALASVIQSHHQQRWFGKQGTWQLVSLFVVWIYLWCLQLDNDGLWYQGDSPRHAMNGFFWLDYLRDFTLDAKSYALSYYARFPAIDPAARPPLFYLLEGTAFVLLGPSPYVAKGLVLCFALVAAVYVWAWLRRWISEEAAWAAGLFLLLPGISRWSHAIMLNIPALTLSIAALYHTRRWLDTPNASLRNFWLVPILLLFVVLTYYTAGIVVFAVAGYVIFHRHVEWSFGRKEILLLILTIVGFLPFAWLITRWAPMHVSWAVPKPAHLVTLSNWLFYPALVLQLCNLHLLVLAVIGAASFLWDQRWRHEVRNFAIWIALLYLPLSFFEAKDLRYALLLSVPFIGLAAIAVIQLSEWIAAYVPRFPLTSKRVTIAVFLTLLMVQISLAASYRVISVSGYKEVAAYIAQVAPNEAVFYDGVHDGNFIFYMRAGDPKFRRRVVLGSKLLYTYFMHPGWRQQEFVHSPEEVIEVLRQRGGCRWLVVEMGGKIVNALPKEYLRQAVTTSAFELVRSFPITAGNTSLRADVYRFTLPVDEVDEVELPFAALGPDVKYRVRPIPSR